LAENADRTNDLCKESAQTVKYVQNPHT
jgi:hypothetical protein